MFHVLLIMTVHPDTGIVCAIPVVIVIPLIDVIVIPVHTSLFTNGSETGIFGLVL